MGAQAHCLGLLAAVGLVCLAPAQAACVGSPVTLSSYSSFEYAAAYSSAGGCQLATVKASRLYMYGACVSDRDNNFGNALPTCDKYGAVTNFTEATCDYIFAHGPSSAFVTSPSLNSVFDDDDICNPGVRGYFFAQTNCTTFDQADLQVSVKGYQGGYCWYGDNLSKGGIAGAVIGVLIILLLIGWLVWVLIRRRQRATGAVSNIAMQPYGPYPGAAGYSEGQSAGTGSVPAAYPTGPQGPYGLSATPGPSHNPFEEKPATGIPVGTSSGGYQRFS